MTPPDLTLEMLKGTYPTQLAAVVSAPREYVKKLVHELVIEGFGYRSVFTVSVTGREPRSFTAIGEAITYYNEV